MSVEIVESFINDRADNLYFGSQVECNLLKSSTLNLARTALKNVNYQSYYLHFILGSILSLPAFPRLIDNHNIEDIFFKWQTLHLEAFVRKNPQILKVVITKKIGEKQRSIIYRSFSFDPDESSLFESSRVTNDDIEDLIKSLKSKNRLLEQYSLESALHYALIKPEDGKPYDIRQEQKVIYEGSRIFDFLNIFQTVASENSPMQVLELVLSLTDTGRRFTSYASEEHLIETRVPKFIDLTDHNKLNFDLDQVFSKEGMRMFFDRITQMYRYYDTKFDSQLSASRIDHCGFVHGIIMMNMQEKHKLHIFIENNEIMYHDTVQMVIQQRDDSDRDTIDLLENPTIIEFQDQGSETGVMRTVSKVKKAGSVKLLPHVQTLAKNCLFMAVNLISPISIPKIIELPLLKYNDEKTENLISVIRNGAEMMYKAGNEVMNAQESVKRTADKLIDKMMGYISVIQSDKLVYHVPADVRYLSLYLLGEASTSDLPVHIAEYTNVDHRDVLFNSVEPFVTTFVLETHDPKYDIILNIFEGPKKYVGSGVKFLPRKSGLKVEKRLVINLNVFPRHPLSLFEYSDEYVTKDFIDKRISIGNFEYDHLIPYHQNNGCFITDGCPENCDQTSSITYETPVIDSTLMIVPKTQKLRLTILDPLDTPKKILEKSTRALLFNFRYMIRNDRHVEAMFRGVFNGQNIVSVIDGLADEKSLIFVTDQTKLIKIRFFTLSSDTLDMAKKVMTLKNREKNIHKSYSIIVQMEAQHEREISTLVEDEGSNLKNVETFLDICSGRSRRSTSACSISLEEVPPTKSPRLRRIVDKVNRLSRLTGHGVLFKDMLGDLYDGDLAGLAMNMGIISTGLAISQGVEKLSTIFATEKSALGYSLKVGAPFLRRLTSGFIIYDLISNIKNYQDETSAVSIAQDSTFLIFDTIDIGTEISEALGFAVPGFLGPLGVTAGLALWVGGDIYKAVKGVDNADKMYHLTTNEKWELGARLFFHIDTKSFIQKAERRHLNELKAESAINILKEHRNMQYYVSTIDNKRETIVYFDYEPHKGRNSLERLVCASDPTFLRFQKLYLIDLQLHTCQNSFIVENSNYTEPGVVFMDPRNTSSEVIGLINTDHIFLISNAEYDIIGSKGDDIFVVSGSSIKGYLDGAAGFNTLDLEHLDPYAPLHVTPETLGIDASYICFKNINNVKGRLGSNDYLETWPQLEKIDLLGGADYYNYDQIHVHNHTNLHITARNFTHITFHENITGNFVTNFSYPSFWIDIKVDRSTENATFMFVLNFQFTRANFRNVNGSLIFRWNKIFGCTSQLCILKFEDNLTIHTKNDVAELTTNLSVNQIINKYARIYKRLECLFIVQIVPKNTVMIFAHSASKSGSTIMHNDPYRKTHFFGNVGENIYVISSVDNRTLSFRDIIIHRNSMNTGNFTEIIDLRLVGGMRHKFSCSVHKRNIVIRIVVEDQFSSKIILQNFPTFPKNFLLIGNVPMRIEGNKSCSIRPIPLIFNHSETLIVIKRTDVENDQQIHIDRYISKRHIFYTDNDDMILTDFFYKSRNNTGFMLILEHFYDDAIMKTLNIEMSNEALNLHSDEFNKENALDIHMLEHILH